MKTLRPAKKLAVTIAGTMTGASVALSSIAPHAAGASVVAPVQTPVSTIPATTKHNAFPSAVRLTDGRLLAVFRGAAHHRAHTSTGSLYRSYSSNNGLTWTVPVKTPLKRIDGLADSRRNHSDPGLMIPTYGPFKGKIIMTYFENFGDHAESRVVVSQDATGETWGVPRNVNIDPRWTSTLVSSPVTQIGSRTFILGGYGRVVRAQPTPPSVSTRVFSIPDRGPLHYGHSARLAIAGGSGTKSLMFTEPNIISLGRGRLLALTRTNRFGHTALHIRKSYSYDSGRTWTRHQYAYTGEGAPHMVRLRSGAILVTGRHWAGPQRSQSPGRHWSVYRISTDNGLTWSRERAYGQSPAKWMTYAAPVEYAPGKVLLITSLENTEEDAKIKVFRASNLLPDRVLGRQHSVGTSIHPGRAR